MARYHTLAQGECLSSIAFQNGYFPGTIWEHPQNDELRELRGDPNVLMPGDKLFLPDKDAKTTACATGKRHQFVRRGVPARFRLQISNADKPRPNLKYRLTIDGSTVIEGATTAAGVLDVPIPPDAHHGLLYIEEDDAEYELSFGRLSPAGEDSGIRQRLANLGYLRSGEVSDADLAAAIAMFQRKAGLDVTGALDEATADELRRGHDKKS